MNPTDQKNKFMELADSVTIYNICEKIGTSYGLHIDQIGELDAQIRAILRGKARPDTFTKDIQELLGIDQNLAQELTEEINKQVFQDIKSSLGEIPRQKTISAVEKAGDFTIEREQTFTKPVPQAVPRPEPKPEPKKEPLADQLLRSPTTAPVQPLVPVPKIANEPVKPTGSDPYREAVE